MKQQSWFMFVGYLLMLGFVFFVGHKIGYVDGLSKLEETMKNTTKEARNLRYLVEKQVKDETGCIVFVKEIDVDQ